MVIWATRDYQNSTGGDLIHLWPLKPWCDGGGNYYRNDDMASTDMPASICSQFFHSMVVGLELKPGECKRLDGKFHYKEEVK